jgi:hypothetical protein
MLVEVLVPILLFCFIVVAVFRFASRIIGGFS